MASQLPSDRQNPVAGNRRRAPRARGVLATAVALAVGISGAVLAAGGSYAYLNAATPMGDSGTVSSGSARLLVSQGGGAPAGSVSIPASVFQNMLPGDVASRQLVLHNTGVVPLRVSARLDATRAWDVRLAAGTCPTTTLPGAALGTTSSTVVTALQPGATATVCLQLVLPTSAPSTTEGTAATYAVTLDGIQVAP
ncbi:hypothetical protein [Demequina sp. NBRC 110053]|uniref:hypothetical protein n=1 Tax=Demequina sp. NBRC 110053 TaxID=1570342 RepID=UPI0011862EC1|nr:hypothetical protein [Demequina sp. NBRC 110053]